MSLAELNVNGELEFVGELEICEELGTWGLEEDSPFWSDLNVKSNFCCPSAATGTFRWGGGK